MPRKIKELIRDLEQADFRNIKTKGSHRKFVHPRYPGAVTLSGGDNDEAKHYQEKQVKQAIEIANERQ